MSFELIDNYVRDFKEVKNVPLLEKIYTLTDRFPVYFIEVPIENLAEYVLTSIKFYKDQPYKYLQLIYPDTKGLFPIDSGYDYDQEIIGELKY